MKLFIFVSLFALSCTEGYNYYQPEQYYGSLDPYDQTQQFPQHYQSTIPTVNPGYNKEFYSFTAPQEQFEDPLAFAKIAATVQKNVRVVFIRNPENNGLENAALALANQAAHDKTAIYVLNKQQDIGDLASRLNTIRHHAYHKPEVHFVKYRTPEEATLATQYIQTQYQHQLPGQSYHSNEVVAPVLNFASKAVEPTHYSTNSYGSGAYPYGVFGETFGQEYAHTAESLEGGSDYTQHNTNIEPRFLNDRGTRAGSSFVFPTDVAGSNTYIPLLKRRH